MVKMVKRSKKKKDGRMMNTLRCVIPGLNGHMNIAFPPRKLPVCEKCKKIYKTRQLCRERDCHTDRPWNKTYVCFILDDSCFGMEDGTRGSVIVPEDQYKFTASIVECSPTKYFAHFDSRKGQLDPICAPCKVKNYTKNHCRVKHAHKNLPWGTVYMTLKAEKIEVECKDDDDNSDDTKTGSKRLPSSLTSRNKKRVKHESLACTKSSSDSDNIKSSSSFISRRTPAHLYSNRNGSDAFLLTLSSEICDLQWLTTCDVENRDPNNQSKLHESSTENTAFPLSKPKAEEIDPTSFSSSLPPREKIVKTAETRNQFESNEYQQLTHIESIQSFGSMDNSPRQTPIKDQENEFDCWQASSYNYQQDSGSVPGGNYSRFNGATTNPNGRPSSSHMNQNYEGPSSQAMVNRYYNEYDNFPHNMYYPGGPPMYHPMGQYADDYYSHPSTRHEQEMQACHDRRDEYPDNMYNYRGGGTAQPQHYQQVTMSKTVHYNNYNIMYAPNHGQGGGGGAYDTMSSPNNNDRIIPHHYPQHPQFVKPYPPKVVSPSSMPSQQYNRLDNSSTSTGGIEGRNDNPSAATNLHTSMEYRQSHDDNDRFHHHNYM